MIDNRIISVSADDFHKDFNSNAFMFRVVTRALLLDGFPMRRVCRISSGVCAVFRSGKVVVKIFPDNRFVWGSDERYNSELFAYKRFFADYISAPRLVSHGSVDAKYHFKYMIFPFIPGVTLRNLRIPPDNEKKRIFAKQMDKITLLINFPEQSVNSIDVLENARKSDAFSSMPQSFIDERLEAIDAYRPNCYKFTHGNLTRDNILVGHDDRLYVTGFSHACNAPIEYETAPLVIDLFGLDPAYIRGYYGLYDSFELTERVLIGALIHENGFDLLTNAFGDITDISHVNMLRDKIFKQIKLR